MQQKLAGLPLYLSTPLEWSEKKYIIVVIYYHFGIIDIIPTQHHVSSPDWEENSYFCASLQKEVKMKLSWDEWESMGGPQHTLSDEWYIPVIKLLQTHFVR